MVKWVVIKYFSTLAVLYLLVICIPAPIILKVLLSLPLFYNLLSYSLHHFSSSFLTPSSAFSPAHLVGYVISLTPAIIYLISFSSAPLIPISIRPEISKDDLPKADEILFDQPLTYYFDNEQNQTVQKDLLSWLCYGVLHYVSPVVCMVWLGIVCWKRSVQKLKSEERLMLRSRTPNGYITENVIGEGELRWRRRSYKEILGRFNIIFIFLAIFGVMNFLGVVTQIFFFPSAPPWYVEKYPDLEPDYSFPGEPAGLSRIDRLFNTNFYEKMFKKSPLVFGSFPSLHSAYATLVILFLVELHPYIHISIPVPVPYAMNSHSSLKLQNSKSTSDSNTQRKRTNSFGGLSKLLKVFPQFPFVPMNKSDVKPDRRNDYRPVSTGLSATPTSSDSTMPPDAIDSYSSGVDRSADYSSFMNPTWKENEQEYESIVVVSVPPNDHVIQTSSRVDIEVARGLPDIEYYDLNGTMEGKDESINYWSMKIPSIFLFVLYVYWQWWSTLYLSHHFFVDLVGGSAYAVLGYAIGRRSIKNALSSL
ncbi:hypothetical protein BKA69DRAFT_1167974 [Paraphysoderma sedebokerense]|nr:hypothetical protein BKA69DRAFT_1167974 [Paraphysoderma sedebokerense]